MTDQEKPRETPELPPADTMPDGIADAPDAAPAAEVNEADLNPIPPGVSPGAMLREAREAAGLALDTLAAQVKLSPMTLMAMESDDFVTLNEPVYVRGYYRKCAQVLDLPVEEVVGAYERAAKPRAPALPTKLPVVPGGEMPVGGGRARFFLLLGLILAAVAAAAWWLGRPVATVPEAGVGTSPQMVPAAPAERGSRAPQPAPASEPAAAAPQISEAASGAEAVAEPEPTASSTEAAPPPAAGILKISFREESWIRVEDATGRNLLDGLQRAGTALELEGEPPFDTFLGNAPGVRITYQDRAVDLGPHTRRNRTAALKVP
jgi:cytoskeleton protein RodZ